MRKIKEEKMNKKAIMVLAVALSVNLVGAGVLPELRQTEFINNRAWALSTVQSLGRIEKHIFGFENPKLKESERLSKIEKFAYGSEKSGKVSDRIIKLNEDLGLNLEPAISSTNGEETGAARGIQGKNASQNQGTTRTYEYYDEDEFSEAQARNEKPDASAQYPIVDNIEQSLLKQTYKTENIYKRLDRLEQKAFGRISKSSLNERVDKLSMLTARNKPDEYTDDSYLAEDKYGDKYYTPNDMDYNYFSPKTTSGNRANSYESNKTAKKLPNPFSIKRHGGGSQNSALLREISSLEKNLFKKTYGKDDIDTRLNRLEREVLHREFTNEPDEERLERLSTISNAKNNSTVYNENKWMKHLGTGIQIGGMLLMILAMLI